MAKVESRDDLAAYCLRQLGHPVIRINVSADHIDDAIDETLEEFKQYHEAATFESVVVVEIQQVDIDRGHLVLPKQFNSVISVHQCKGQVTGRHSYTFHNPLWNLTARVIATASDNTYAVSAGDIDMIKQRIRDINDTAGDTSSTKGHSENFTYNQYSDTLELLDSGSLMVGDIYMIYGYTQIDEELHPKVYGDKWVKKYCTACIKETWANVLRKLKGVQLAGGITLDGDGMFSEAVEEKRQLIEELKDQHQRPPAFFVG